MEEELIQEIINTTVSDNIASALALLESYGKDDQDLRNAIKRYTDAPEAKIKEYRDIYQGQDKWPL